MHFDLFINLLVFQRLIDAEVEAFWVDFAGDVTQSMKSHLARWSDLRGLETFLGSPA